MPLTSGQTPANLIPATVAVTLIALAVEVTGLAGQPEGVVLH